MIIFQPQIVLLAISCVTVTVKSEQQNINLAPDIIPDHNVLSDKEDQQINSIPNGNKYADERLTDVEPVSGNKFSKDGIDLDEQFDSALMPGPVMPDKGTATSKGVSDSFQQIDIAKQFDSALMPGPVIPDKETAEKIAETDNQNAETVKDSGKPFSGSPREQTDMAKSFDSALMPGPVIPDKKTAEKIAKTDNQNAETVKDSGKPFSGSPREQTDMAKSFDSALMPGPVIPDKKTAEKIAETDNQNAETVKDSGKSLSDSPREQTYLARSLDSALMPGPDISDKETAEKITETDNQNAETVKDAEKPLSGPTIEQTEMAKTFDSALMPGPVMADKQTAETVSDSEKPLSGFSKEQIDLAKNFGTLLMPGPVIPDKETAQKLANSGNGGNGGITAPDPKLPEENLGKSIPETPAKDIPDTGMDAHNAFKDQETQGLANVETLPVQPGSKTSHSQLVNNIPDIQSDNLIGSRPREQPPNATEGNMIDKESAPGQQVPLVSEKTFSDSDKNVENGGSSIGETALINYPDQSMLKPAAVEQKLAVMAEESKDITTRSTLNTATDDLESTDINKYLDDNAEDDEFNEDGDFDDDDDFEGDLDYDDDDDNDKDENNFFDNDGDATSTERNDNDKAGGREDDSQIVDPFQWNDQTTDGDYFDDEDLEEDETDFSYDEDESYDEDYYDEEEQKSLNDEVIDEDSYARKVASNNMGFDQQLYGTEPTISVYSWILFFVLLFITLSFFAVWSRHRVFGYLHQLRHGKQYNMHYRREEGKSLLSHEMV